MYIYIHPHIWCYGFTLERFIVGVFYLITSVDTMFSYGLCYAKGMGLMAVYLIISVIPPPLSFIF